MRDIQSGTVNYYSSPCEGYGPLEDTVNPANGVIRYYLDLKRLLSRQPQN